jgi:hypothetical protein
MSAKEIFAAYQRKALSKDEALAALTSLHKGQGTVATALADLDGARAPGGAANGSSAGLPVSANEIAVIGMAGAFRGRP